MPFPFITIPDVHGDTGFKLPFHACSRSGQSNRGSGACSPTFPAGGRAGIPETVLGTDVIPLPYMYNANLAIRVRSLALWHAAHAMHDGMRIDHYMSQKQFPKDGKDSARRRPP
jgi:hypothetical protein